MIFHFIREKIESIFVNLSTKTTGKKIIDVDDDIIDDTTSRELI